MSDDFQINFDDLAALGLIFGAGDWAMFIETVEFLGGFVEVVGEFVGHKVFRRLRQNRFVVR